jgi:hypothetical protein
LVALVDLDSAVPNAEMPEGKADEPPNGTTDDKQQVSHVGHFIEEFT